MWDSDWKFYNDQAYSRPRDMSLSASLGPNYVPPETHLTSQNYGTGALKGAFNWALMMPRDVSLSDSIVMEFLPWIK